MSAHRSYGVAVTQRSWTEVVLVVLAFAFVLGVLRLAAFDGQHEAQAKEVDAVSVLTDAVTPP